MIRRSSAQNRRFVSVAGSVAGLLTSGVVAAAASVSDRDPAPDSPATLIDVTDDGRSKGPRSSTPVFVMDGSRVRAFDPPGPTPPGFPGPVPQDILEINDKGQIVGGYKEDVATPGTAGFRGYLRDPRGRITLLDVPGAAGTSPFDLNDRGEVVGTYSRTNSSTGLAQDKRGFWRDARGRYSTIRVPGSRQTQAFGINNRGQVVGEYEDRNGTFHGFLRNARGRFVTLDVPGSTATAALDINSRGHVVGVYATEGVDEIRAFLLRGRRFQTFDAPGGRYDQPYGLNDRGQIVVSTTNGSLESVRAYVMRKGVGGPFTEVRVPGAPRTFAAGIDDRGRIVGIYENPNVAASRSGRSVASTGVAAIVLGR